MAIFILDLLSISDYKVNMLTKIHILADAKTIKKRLIDLGITQTSIAKDLSVTKSAVSKVISGKSRSDKIWAHIVSKLGIDNQAHDCRQPMADCPKFEKKY